MRPYSECRAMNRIKNGSGRIWHKLTSRTETEKKFPDARHGIRI
jgi:hypothetical protein